VKTVSALLRSAAVGLVCTSSIAALDSPPRAKVGERIVAMDLVKADDLSPAPWPPGGVTLGTVLTRVTEDANVYTLLIRDGIAPDAEAFAVLYDLNPELRDSKTLKIGSNVSLPRVSGSPELLQKVRSGYLVLLSVDPDIRSELNRSVDEMQGTAQSFADLPADRFEPGTMESAKNKIAVLAKWYAQIKKSYLRRTGPPIRRATLLEIRDEAAILNSLLRQTVIGNRQFTSTDQEQLAAIYQDVQSEMVKYGEVLANEAPKAEALIKVIVTIRGGDTKLIDALRVYYTFNGVFRDPPSNPPVTSYSFKELGSGRSELLPVKNYKVWAARDGDPGHPLTPPLLVSVAAGGSDSIGVDLSLARADSK